MYTEADYKFNKAPRSYHGLRILFFPKDKSLTHTKSFPQELAEKAARRAAYQLFKLKLN